MHINWTCFGKRKGERKERKKGKQASGWARLPDNSKKKKEKMKLKNLVKCPLKPNKIYATTVAENSKTQM